MSHNKDEFDAWKTTAETSRLLSLTQRRIRQLVDTGELVGRKISRIWWVSKQSIEEYLRNK